MINVKKDFLNLEPDKTGILVKIGGHEFFLEMTPEEMKNLKNKMGDIMEPESTVIFWDFNKKINNAEQIIEAHNKILNSIEDTVKALLSFSLEIQQAQMQLIGLSKRA